LSRFAHVGGANHQGYIDKYGDPRKLTDEQLDRMLEVLKALPKPEKPAPAPEASQTATPQKAPVVPPFA